VFQSHSVVEGLIKMHCLSRARITIVVCFLLLGPTSQSKADIPAFTFTSPTLDMTNGEWSLGYEFSVNSPITVTQLGFYDSGQDGLLQSHDVGIYDTSQNLLVSGTVAAGTTDPLVDYIRYTTVAPTSLGIGVYFIAAATDTDNYTWDPSGLVSAPQVTWLQDAFVLSSVLAFPSGGPDEHTGIFGPNFQFSAAPEPSSMALCGAAALTGLAFARFRSRSARRHSVPIVQRCPGPARH
jgi:hypothetical protein